MTIMPSWQLKRRQKALTERVALEIDLPKLFKRIDNIEELNGARIIYIDGTLQIFCFGTFNRAVVNNRSP